MAYSASKIECLRFAGRHKAEGIGCCAIDLFQGFINDPEAKAHVKLVQGDTGIGLIKNNKPAYLGTTNKDIFLQYLRIGTFDTQEMPNRIFLAALTENQCRSSNGKAWLAILKENGFEFIRVTDNSVYTGKRVSRDIESESCNKVYLFGLFRNIGATRITDPFAPPPEWDALPAPVLTDFDRWEQGYTNVLTEEQAKGEAPAPTREEAEAAGSDYEDDECCEYECEECD